MGETVFVDGVLTRHISKLDYFGREQLTCQATFDDSMTGVNNADRLVEFCRTHVSELAETRDVEIRAGIIDCLAELIAEGAEVPELAVLRVHIQAVFGPGSSIKSSEDATSFRLVYVGAASLRCRFASASPTGEPTRGKVRSPRRAGNDTVTSPAAELKHALLRLVFK